MYTPAANNHTHVSQIYTCNIHMHTHNTKTQTNLPPTNAHLTPIWPVCTHRRQIYHTHMHTSPANLHTLTYHIQTSLYAHIHVTHTTHTYTNLTCKYACVHITSIHPLCSNMYHTYIPHTHRLYIQIHTHTTHILHLNTVRRHEHQRHTYPTHTYTHHAHNHVSHANTRITQHTHTPHTHAHPKPLTNAHATHLHTPACATFVHTAHTKSSSSSHRGSGVAAERTLREENRGCGAQRGHWNQRGFPQSE